MRICFLVTASATVLALFLDPLSAGIDMGVIRLDDAKTLTHFTSESQSVYTRPFALVPLDMLWILRIPVTISHLSHISHLVRTRRLPHADFLSWM